MPWDQGGRTCAAFLEHLAGIEEQTRLLRSFDGMLTTGAMPEYLFRRLIEDGSEAISSGEEQLTPELLARTTIRLGNLADLDAEAGEIPEIPQDVRGRRLLLDLDIPAASAQTKLARHDGQK